MDQNEEKKEILKNNNQFWINIWDSYKDILIWIITFIIIVLVPIIFFLFNYSKDKQYAWTAVLIAYVILTISMILLIKRTGDD